jgi:hypothetical protein
MTDLLPCPFCGSQDIKTYSCDDDSFTKTLVAECQDCLCKIESSIDYKPFSIKKDYSGYELAWRKNISETWNSREKTKNYKWIPVTEDTASLPRKKCLAHYKNSNGNGRTVCAFYAGKFEFEQSYSDDCNIKYCDHDDRYYLAEGWYEVIDNWDEFSSVAITEGEVTHWMKLPDAPDVGTDD